MTTTFWKKLVADEEGQDLIEYALLAGAISLGCVLTVVSLGNGVNTVWDGVETQVDQIPTS